jgi:serine/threonine-protein kinase
VNDESESEKLLELLVEWEELRRQGKDVTPEQLCPDDPSLQATFRERLARRQRLQAALDLPGSASRGSLGQSPSLPVIEDYEVGELLGRGGMGVVFRATHKPLKRDVALKIIISGTHAGAEERARWRTEAEAVARLHHPGIVQIYEVGEQSGCPYMALELLGGGSLERRLNGTPMRPRQAAELLLAIARALQHAHDQGIVHRDLKPANILLTEKGDAKISDFGLAKLLDVEKGQTRTGAVLGSPSYMAPEQAAGAMRRIGPRTDIYALGAILYELLTGRPPFVGASILETLDQVRNHDPAPPQTLQPSVAPDLATICLKCLEKDLTDRYPTAAALAHDLDLFLLGEPITARKMTLWGQATRLIRHTQVDANWGAWARLVLWLAPLPVLLQIAAFALLRDRSEYPPVAIAATLGTVAVLIVLSFYGKRASLRTIVSDQRRRNVSIWLGNAIGVTLIAVTVVRVMHPTAPEEWFVIYAFWLILLGCMFFSLGANAGVLYLNGSLCFFLALIAPFVLFYLPLIAGALMSLNVMTIGLLVRRVARESTL